MSRTPKEPKMKIGKLEITKWSWSWGGARMKNPIRILLSMAMWPIWHLGRALIFLAVLLSELSLADAIYAWESTE